MPLHLPDASPCLCPPPLRHAVLACLQVRVGPTNEGCRAKPLSGSCYLNTPDPGSAPSPFGYNWTDPSAPPHSPWRYHTAEALGTNPDGIFSAFMPSLAPFEGGGFVASVVPFFSSVYLPEQKGASSEVLNFRKYRIRGGGAYFADGCAASPTGAPLSERADAVAIEAATRGASDGPNVSSSAFSPAVGGFFCVRLTHNGEFIHQLCDPNAPYLDPHGRTTGVVRAAIEEWWNDLRRGHFIDVRTRLLTIVLPFRNSNEALRSRMSLMLETTAYGAVLPSYDIEARVDGEESYDNMAIYGNIAFGFCVFFMFLEAVEFFKVGPLNYFTDVWNLMDWANFLIFIVTWITLHNLLYVQNNRKCSVLCAQVGYCDDWEVNAACQPHWRAPPAHRLRS